MKIYTKTGDKGETALFGGQRVPKDALRVEAYGTVDELNALLGLVLAGNDDPRVASVLTPIQQTLFTLGADLATPPAREHSLIVRITPEDAHPLERIIDDLEKELPELGHFIVPGGSLTASRLHLARTVCRRAERAVVRLTHQEGVGRGIIIYLNRLSDLLFVLARYANMRAGDKEVQWKSTQEP